MRFGLLCSFMLTPPVCVRRLQHQLLCFSSSMASPSWSLLLLARRGIAARSTVDRASWQRSPTIQEFVVQHETSKGEWSGSSVRHRSRRMHSSRGGASTWRLPARARESRGDCARAASDGSARSVGRLRHAESSRDTARVRAASSYISALTRVSVLLSCSSLQFAE